MTKMVKDNCEIGVDIEYIVTIDVDTDSVLVSEDVDLIIEPETEELDPEAEVLEPLVEKR